MRAHNAVCDRYGLARAHPLHQDLPPRNPLEKQALAFFQSIVEPLPPPPQLDQSSLFDGDGMDVDALLALELPSPTAVPPAAVHEALQISTAATASDTPPPPTFGSAGSSLSLQPRTSSSLASASAAALVPSWLALPSEEAPPPTVLAALGVRQLPSLVCDGTPFDRPFCVSGLPSVATLGERRAAAKAARAELEAVVTVEAFNAALGSGELRLAEGEEWMLTHNTHHNNLCVEGTPCFDANHTVDKRTGKKRAPQRRELHHPACKQRRCLEVKLALRKGQRVVCRKPKL